MKTKDFETVRIETGYVVCWLEIYDPNKFNSESVVAPNRGSFGTEEECDIELIKQQKCYDDYLVRNAKEWEILSKAEAMMTDEWWLEQYERQEERLIAKFEREGV